MARFFQSSFHKSHRVLSMSEGEGTLISLSRWYTIQTEMAMFLIKGQFNLSGQGSRGSSIRSISLFQPVMSMRELSLHPNSSSSWLWIQSCLHWLTIPQGCWYDTTDVSIRDRWIFVEVNRVIVTDDPYSITSDHLPPFYQARLNPRGTTLLQNP